MIPRKRPSNFSSSNMGSNSLMPPWQPDLRSSMMASFEAPRFDYQAVAHNSDSIFPVNRYAGLLGMMPVQPRQQDNNNT
jgi:hypothetical protein